MGAWLELPDKLHALKLICFQSRSLILSSSPRFTFSFLLFISFFICAEGWTQRLLHVRQALHLWARTPYQSLVSTDLDRNKINTHKRLYFKVSFAVFLMYILDFAYGNVEYVSFCTWLLPFLLNLKHFLWRYFKIALVRLRFDYATVSLHLTAIKEPFVIISSTSVKL